MNSKRTLSLHFASFCTQTSPAGISRGKTNSSTVNYCSRENLSTLWQYLLLQIYKTLPNLTLPDQFSIPNPATTILPQATNPDDFKNKISCHMIFVESPKIWQNEFGTAKVQL